MLLLFKKERSVDQTEIKNQVTSSLKALSDKEFRHISE